MATCRSATVFLVWASTLAVAGYAGAQSALDPAGREAQRIADLFWFMLSGGVAIWLGVSGLTLYCGLVQPESFSLQAARRVIVAGGTIISTVVLAVVLAFGLAMLPSLVAAPSDDTLRISVSGELWWWRVRYEIDGGETVELANEIHLPVGEPVEFRLESDNVIHSFWIPSLGGKMDMIPGRTTRLSLTPTRTGLFRGVCAEFCGSSHALMKFAVVVEERAEFERWFARQAAPAEPPTEPLVLRGQEYFLGNGCGACHQVRGTPATGVIGPDLTHVGSRLKLAAGTLPSGADHFARWIARTEDIKPGAHMPKFSMLPLDEREAIAVYLEGLQ